MRSGPVKEAVYSRRYWRRNKAKSPDCLTKEAEPEPTSYSVARSSKQSDVWTEEMSSESEGLEAAGTFVEISEHPGGSNVVESRWFLKWKGDAHGMVERAKARLVAEGLAREKELITSRLLPQDFPLDAVKCRVR